MTQRIDIVHGTAPIRLQIADAVHVEPIVPWGAESESEPQEGQSIEDRVASALAHPDQILAIGDLLVPGDSVAVALESGLPSPEAIVAGILRSLARRQLGKIQIVADQSLGEPALSRLQATLPPTVELVVHHAAHPGALAYVGADERAEPIRVNRSLVDADVVLPVSVMRLSDPLLGSAGGDAVYPDLVDDAQRKRLQDCIAGAVARGELDGGRWAARQARQISWTLGIQLVLAVEVTAGGQVGRVIASSPEALQDAMQTQSGSAHGEGSPEAADVVLACIEGDDSQQSLENLLRAALAARSHAARSGTVVLITSLKQLPLTSSSELQREEDSQSAADDEIADWPTAHSQARFAAELLSDLINQWDSSRRYLLMYGGDWEAAEAFGFGVVQDATALARLVNQHSSCRVLRVAQTAAAAGVLSGRGS